MVNIVKNTIEDILSKHPVISGYVTGCTIFVLSIIHHIDEFMKYGSTHLEDKIDIIWHISLPVIFGFLIVYIGKSIIEIRERKIAEEALRENKKRLDFVISSSPAVVYTSKAYGDYGATFISENVKQQMGYNSEDFIKDTNFWADHIHPEDRERILKGTSKIFEIGNHVHEYRFKHKDGSYRWMHDEMNLIKDENNEPKEIIGSWLDITERKNAEAEKEKLLHNLGERVKELDCLYSFSKIIEMPNISLEEMLQELADVIPHGWHYPEITCARIVLDGQEHKTGNFKETIWRQSGDIQVFGKKVGSLEVYYLEEKPELYEGPFLKEERNLINALAERFGRVIERMEAEEALQASERKYRTLSFNIPGMVYRGKSDWSTEIVTDSERLCGYSPKELSFEETNWLTIIHPDDKEKMFEESSKLLEESTSIVQEYRIKAKDGSIRWVSDHKTSLFTEDGVFQGIDGVVFDITERKMMESKLSHAQKMESIGHLAAGIAHEINTPTQYIGDNLIYLSDTLSDIMTLVKKFKKCKELTEKGVSHLKLKQEVGSNLEEIDIEYLSEEIPEAIKQSIEGNQRVSEIVQAMKEFSHPGVEGKTAIDINKAISSTITVARNEWKYVADMKTDFDQDLPLIECLPGEFNQVILNIILNAVHAITEKVDDSQEEKGFITVSTKSNGDWAEIRISDNGTGIPENARSKIFDPFFTTKVIGKGTGQGLSISYDIIVNKHGGMITFETEAGRGTTFIICLPL